ncbi:MAG: ferritin family protein [Planctomycetota bacterium]
MKREAILQAAIKLEEDGRKFYLAMAGDAENDLARRTFESFAKDEANHIAWIKETLGGGGNIAPADDAANAVYASVKKIFARVPASKKGKLGTSKDELKALKIAMGKEEASIKAYRKWADQSTDAEIAELFTSLAAVERVHRDLLANTREYLEKTGDWFMVQEQWSFDGG